MKKIFGTDGVRGVANQYPMTSEVALSLGRAVAYQAKTGNHRHRIVIGKDTRLSGYMLEMAFASGVCSMGVDALLVGPLPTPAIAFLVKDLRADAGVMISASHNPYEDNGIKIFGKDGFKLSDNKEIEIETIITNEKVGKIRPTKDEVGKAFKIDDARGRYSVYLKNAFPSDISLGGLKIVVDCANGAAYKVAPNILEELGATVYAINSNPDGRNINHKCGATDTNQLQWEVKDKKAHVGLALDGDGDRLIAVDDEGHVLDGDHLLCIAAWDMLQAGKLNNNTIIATHMSNLALSEAIAGFGGRLFRTNVGDKYVVEEMRNGNYNLGGEQSGHIIYLDHSTTGDGIVASLKLLSTMIRYNRKLSALRNILTPYPQVLINVPVVQKPPLDSLIDAQQIISQAKTSLGAEGRVMVRYSGTEPKVRVLVEGKDKKIITKMANAIVEELKKAIGE